MGVNRRSLVIVVSGMYNDDVPAGTVACINTSLDVV